MKSINTSPVNHSHDGVVPFERVSLGLRLPHLTPSKAQSIYSSDFISHLGDSMNRNDDYPKVLEVRQLHQKKQKRNRLFSKKSPLRGCNQTPYGKPFVTVLEVYVPEPTQAEVVEHIISRSAYHPLVVIKMQNGNRWVMESLTLDNFLASGIPSLLKDELGDVLLAANRAQMHVESIREGFSG